MKTKRKIKMSVGVSSMLMIFVVLCLTTFAVLSYVTANADAQLTDKAVQAAQRYYEADNQAEQTIARLDAQVLRAREAARLFVETGEPPQTGGEALEKLQAIDRAAQGAYRQAYLALIGTSQVEQAVISVSGEQAVASFQIPAGDTQQLEVEVRLPAEPEAKRCVVISRKLVGTADLWEDEDQPLELWQGQP